jgi:hypothetical protein
MNLPTTSTTNSSSSTSFSDRVKRAAASFANFSGGDLLHDQIEKLNPLYDEFYGTGSNREEKLASLSVSHEEPNMGASAAYVDSRYAAFLYAPLDLDKEKRLRDYRIMAAFAEVSHALDEIVGECLVQQDDGAYLTLKMDQSMDASVREELQKQFSKFVSYFDFDNRGIDYFRSLLIDGEVFFENIISSEHLTAGILGVAQIPTELMNPVYENIQNCMIKGFLLKKYQDIKKENQHSKSNSQTHVFVPMDKNQVTYANSGVWNEDKTVRLPFIENARRAYRQLSMIEDSIVIYRMSRAPERLAFHVEVGNMPAPKAESYLKRLMQQFWTKKTFDQQQGKGINMYDPQSLMDNFWFTQRNGVKGTEVVALPGGQNLGQLEDLEYFIKKLYKSLRVPTSRLDPSTTFADGAEITREELKFARFIISIQKRLAIAVKNSFMTHLKLNGLWDSYELKERDLNINFVEPTHFHAMRLQQLHEMKVNNFKNMIDTQVVSTTYAMMTQLGFTEQQIRTNREWMRKDMAFKWELSKIEEGGSNWRDAYDAEQESGGGGGGAEGGADMGGMGMGMGGGSALPEMPVGGETGAPVEDVPAAEESEENQAPEFGAGPTPQS